MFHRSAVLAAVAGLLVSSGFALADAPKLSLDPSVITADGAASQGLLMQGLDKAGLGKTLADAKLNIYGWVESGYTYNHRHGSDNQVIVPGPFNTEPHNHYMLNQVVLRFERQVDTKKFDVGGLVEVMYGTDSHVIHPYGGLGFDGDDKSDDTDPNEIRPQFQFDIPQAYVTVNLPVGNGLQFMVGKFVTLLSYETIDPRGNPFYSHSYLFNAVPFTHVGIMGMYQVSDQLGVKLGVTRGWDMATEDNNGSVDVIGQVSYQFTKQLGLAVYFSVGPENNNDSSHYRSVIDPIVTWQVTDALKIGLETLYLYDGGLNGNISGFSEGRTHAYGDVWGAALYAGYTVNENLTVNARLEKAHGYIGSFNGQSLLNGDAINALSVYEVTLGTTITPLPKDQYLKGLSVRPEIRYDFTDSTANKFFPASGTSFKDQLTFACDVIFAF
jgi:hypothetical protein